MSESEEPTPPTEPPTMPPEPTVIVEHDWRPKISEGMPPPLTNPNTVGNRRNAPKGETNEATE